jgi:hypothetical protein
MMMMMTMMKAMSSSPSPSSAVPIAAARRLVSLPATPLVGRRRRRRGGEVVIVATSSSSSSSSSVVKSRQKVKENFPQDILSACERCEKEFELRAELDARNPDARVLRVGDVLSSCSESSIAFLERDVEDVVREYRNFFEEEKKEAPKKVVVSLSLLRRTLCTKLHVDYVPLRAMTTYFGRKTEVLDERSLVHKVIASAARESASWALPLSDALKSNAKLYEKKLVAERGESCDILFLKGEMWQSGKASVHRSPETTNGGWRLVLRVDEYDAVNQAEEHQQCLVDDDDECGCEE